LERKGDVNLGKDVCGMNGALWSLVETSRGVVALALPNNPYIALFKNASILGLFIGMEL